MRQKCQSQRIQAMTSTYRRISLWRKLAPYWRLPCAPCELPLDESALSRWLAPHLVLDGVGGWTINWCKWSDSAKHLVPTSQSDALLHTVGADGLTFCLRRFVGHAEGRPDAATERVDRMSDRLDLWDRIEGSTFEQALRDEREQEPPMQAVPESQSTSKLMSASHVYVRHTVSGDVEAVLLVGDDRALRASFARPDAACDRIRACAAQHGAEEVVFVDVLLADGRATSDASLRILEHAFACHPNSLFVVHCPIAYPALHFYRLSRFSYDGFTSLGTDLLQDVVEGVGVATRMWSSGYPELTRLRSTADDDQVRICHSEHDVCTDTLQALGPQHLWLRPRDDVPAVLADGIRGIRADDRVDLYIWLPTETWPGVDAFLAQVVDESQRTRAEDPRVRSVTVVARNGAGPRLANVAARVPPPPASRLALSVPRMPTTFFHGPPS